MSKQRIHTLCAAIVMATAIVPAIYAQQPQQTTAAAAPPAVAAPKNQVALMTNEDNRYRIGPGDVLDIRILNRPNLSRDAVRVEGSGMIRMPLIDTEIQAACKTEGELAKEIATRYTKFYRQPQVDVFIKEYHSRQVAVIGATALLLSLPMAEAATCGNGPGGFEAWRVRWSVWRWSWLPSWSIWVRVMPRRGASSRATPRSCGWRDTCRAR